MKNFLLLTLFSWSCFLSSAQIQTFTEIHYDNDGGDVGEFVELFIEDPQPGDISSWTVSLYNGNGGGVYGTHDLSSFTTTVKDGSDGHIPGTYYLKFISGIQNGSPDGLSLNDASGNVIQFLSYEGTMTATDGPAAGLTSTDVGASEPGSTPAGTSMQNDGFGNWTAGLPETPGTPNANNALPVKLISFTVNSANNQNILTWTTATEINNEKFEIERSSNGKAFEKIGEVEGEGNTLTTVDYNFVDLEPISGDNYYRLKQIDFDGGFEYSIVVKAEKRANNVRIYPTTTQDFIMITRDDDTPMIVTFYNEVGQLAKTVSISETVNNISVLELPQGIYFLQVSTNRGLFTEKIIKR